MGKYTLPNFYSIVANVVVVSLLAVSTVSLKHKKFLIELG
jgi:hypothetical protein